ncbi:hypothetical protein GCM10010994_49270 [Chelatococcus reniformis]|uniref:histidine kinase n=1 Tax=Chelatococcus reniformis TaxID=1494448 RepID=A0A916USR0_9HYPH|nr:hypothetical protein GCM10010994_49270 [Chelatococcus reniformis]
MKAIAEALGGPQPRRRWYESIAGRLLLAFALISALTVVATIVAWVRLTDLGRVIDRLTGRSLPAVSLSLELETATAQAVAGAAELARATGDSQRTARLATLRAQTAEVGRLLDQLQRTAGMSPQVGRLRPLVEDIAGETARLDETVQQKVAIAVRRAAATAAVTPATDALSRLLAPLADEIIFDVTLTLEDVAKGRSQAVEGISTDQLPLLQAIYEARTTIATVATLLKQVPTVEEPELLVPLQDQFRAAGDRLWRSLDMVAAKSKVAAERFQQVRGAVDGLLRLGEGQGGLFDLRRAELAAQAAATVRQAAFQAIGRRLSDDVTNLVGAAETEAGEASAATVQGIRASRLWLLVIAGLSLALGILVVWLFVIRYMVHRLVELAGSMLAIAQGDLAAPIPPARPDELGDMSRALTVFRDNAREIHTARDEAERARAAAEEASRTKSSFLANMSHELRTPLNAIIGYSEILLEDAVDRGDEDSQPDLRKIQTAGKHLLGLINDILDLSKIEAGRLDIYLEDVDVQKLVGDVSTLVQPLMQANQNRLVIDCPADIGAMSTDLTKVRQSLLNLLSNAAKFTKAGDVKLDVTAEPGPDGVRRIRFAVTDSGIGMSEEQMGRLFQAFTQADSSTTRNYGGTGLGLTITKHFCVMLGGSIDVTSVPGTGSTFTIVLPDTGAAAPAAAPGRSPIAGRAAAATGPTVLVVDDDPVVHDVLTATLVRDNYRILHARNGEEAMRIARATPPDVITLDVVMPRVDGWSVLGMLKSDPMLAPIPVIMISIVDDRALGYSLGASEFMTKPIDRQRLLTVLRAVVDKPRGGLVLVVDDAPEVREFIRHVVESTGLKVAEAVNGQEALAWLEANGNPSLILLDLMMPVMDGFAFLDAMRATPARLDVPVVVLTAKELADEERTFLAERTMHVFTKGMQSGQSLAAALAAIVARRPERAAE